MNTEAREQLRRIRSGEEESRVKCGCCQCYKPKSEVEKHKVVVEKDVCKACRENCKCECL